jgi:hypothetical protein
MQFEFKNALTDLDEKTPTFFLGEVFSHGSLKVKQEALKALSTLDTEQKSVRVLREILKIA